MNKTLGCLVSILLVIPARTLCAADGVYVGPRLEQAEASVEGGQLVIRQSVIATNAPKALGLLLVDAEPGVKVTRELGALFVEKDRSASTAPHRIFVMLANRPNREIEWRLVLNGHVFWRVEPDELTGYAEKGWISFPVTPGQNPTAVLRAAGVVFGVPEARQFDLRLTEVQRVQAPSIGGEFSRDDLEEVRRLTALMAGRQLLSSLAQADPDRWQGYLRDWPGRHPLKIHGDRNRAAVYYAPDRGFQLERREGKWAVVGG